MVAGVRPVVVDRDRLQGIVSSARTRAARARCPPDFRRHARRDRRTRATSPVRDRHELLATDGVADRNARHAPASCVCQRTSPVFASSARKPPAASPAKTRPPPVATSAIIAGALVVVPRGAPVFTEIARTWPTLVSPGASFAV